MFQEKVGFVTSGSRQGHRTHPPSVPKMETQPRAVSGCTFTRGEQVHVWDIEDLCPPGKHLGLCSCACPASSPGLSLGGDSGDGDFGLPRSCTDTGFTSSCKRDVGQAQPGLAAPWGEEGADDSPPGWQGSREGLKSRAPAWLGLLPTHPSGGGPAVTVRFHRAGAPSHSHWDRTPVGAPLGPRGDLAPLRAWGELGTSMGRAGVWVGKECCAVVSEGEHDLQELCPPPHSTLAPAKKHTGKYIFKSGPERFLLLLSHKCGKIPPKHVRGFVRRERQQQMASPGLGCLLK